MCGVLLVILLLLSSGGVSGCCLGIKIPKCLTCLLPWAVLRSLHNCFTNGVCCYHDTSPWPVLPGPCKPVQLRTSPSPGLPLTFSLLYTSSYNLLSVQLVLIFSSLLLTWFMVSLPFQGSFSAACSCCSFLLALQFQSCSLRARDALQHVNASANFTWCWPRAQMLLAAAGNNSSWNVLFKGLTDN